jgi:hypothetical protein
MNAIVTIFTSELKEKQYITPQLEKLCTEARKVGNACIFSPAPGKLFEFLSVLKFHKVAYGTHFDTKDVSSTEYQS